MSVSVPLTEVVDAMQAQHDEMAFYLDRRTGRIAPVFDEERPDLDPEALAPAGGAAPDPPAPGGDLGDPAAWARAVEADTEGRFVALPDRFEVHEWEMLRRFAHRAGEDHADTLLDAIHGRGAFRAFKDAVHRLGLTEAWYAFRDDEYAEHARGWAEATGVVLIEDRGRA